MRRGVVKCFIRVVDVLGEKKVTLEAHYCRSWFDEDLYEEFADCMGHFHDVEREILMRADEQAAKAGIEVLGWEWTAREFFRCGFSDYYEADVKESDLLDEGMTAFQVEVE